MRRWPPAPKAAASCPASAKSSPRKPKRKRGERSGCGRDGSRCADPRASAKTAAQFDTTTTAQKAAAAAPPASAEKKLGLTVASLGDPTQPGFWIKTPLVKSAGKGRIVNPANGKSAKVDLQPLAGPASSGSQVSLPALQLIGISLTDLPSVEVYQN
ncbi:hypothetical protein [Paracoccus cavernae]|uniref:hypothetical protein n=1 Tax=Paracoccus cavernae TaxID=1571207 RepID=UPI0036335611